MKRNLILLAVAAIALGSILVWALVHKNSREQLEALPAGFALEDNLYAVDAECLDSKSQKVGLFRAFLSEEADLANRTVERICWQLSGQAQCQELGLDFVGGPNFGIDGYMIECSDTHAELTLGQSYAGMVYTTVGFVFEDGKILFKAPEKIDSGDGECFGAGCRSVEDLEILEEL